MDQFVKHVLREKRYIRYTDDFVIVHSDPKYLTEIKDKIEAFLKSRLRLELHPYKVEIRKFSQGIDFLGYVLLPYATVMRTKTKRRIGRKLLEKVIKAKREEISEDSLKQSVASYMGVLSHANSHDLKEKLQEDMWELWKSPEIP